LNAIFIAAKLHLAPPVPLLGDHEPGVVGKVAPPPQFAHTY